MLIRLRTLSCSILLILVAAQLSWGASGGIRGKVTDATTGQALPGANIQLKGTSLGAATDLNGNYVISGVPAGSYVIKASYVGYKTLEVKVLLTENQNLVKNIKLQAVGVTAKEVIVTTQASGQNSAINQQLSSNNVVNVVSAARIESLPDANAAESVGRLPGVSLERSGGQATEVVIRGLAPQYNEITIDGVPIPGNESSYSSNLWTGGTATSGGQGVNLSMISSNTLEGIQVYKTVTPDMDAAVLGGTVNFDIKEAQGTSSGAPLVSLVAQGGYDNLADQYNNYKLVGSLQQRFFDSKFGVFVQGIVQNQNLTSNELGASYYLPDVTQPNKVAISSIDLYYYPTQQKLYDGSLTMDYRIPNGKIDFVNLLSHGNTSAAYYNETYNYGNDIAFNAQNYPATLNVITNILSYDQDISSFQVDAKLSNSYTETIASNNWWINFDQASAGTGNLSKNDNPVQLAQAAAALANYSTMYLNDNTVWNSFTKQRNLSAIADIQKNFDLSDLVSVALKAGGMYMYTTRGYTYSTGGGIVSGAPGTAGRAFLLQNPNLQFLTQSPWNMNPNGAAQFIVSPFFQNGLGFGNFLSGDYSMRAALNMGLLGDIMNSLIAFGKTIKTAPTGGTNPFIPDEYNSGANNYHGFEDRSAGYVMATINIGTQISLIPGVRYQGLLTSYTAGQTLTASETNPYPNPFLFTQVTKNEYHGYWLPDVSLKYDPFAWMSVRAAYTNTLSYPDFYEIDPIMDVFSSSVTYNNYALSPAQSHNYDLGVSVYNNTLGLVSVDPFLKRIDNLIFYQSSFITNPSAYPGIPSYTKGYSINTYINNPYPVDLWGIEAEWQTHFWYLPGILSGLVLDVNFTHIFSQAKYPYTYTTNSGFPFFKSIYIDTSYTDRLLQQPNDLGNLSVGYDYKQFSILVSMIYQSDVYNGTNFYNSLRSDKSTYVRWDLVVNQGLPWYGLQAFLEVDNLNSANDTYVVRGAGYPTSESDYGLTANLGFRWKLQ